MVALPAVLEPYLHLPLRAAQLCRELLAHHERWKFVKGIDTLETSLCHLRDDPARRLLLLFRNLVCAYSGTTFGGGFSMTTTLDVDDVGLACTIELGGLMTTAGATLSAPPHS